MSTKPKMWLVELVEVYVVAHVVEAESAQEAAEKALGKEHAESLPREYHNRGGVHRVLEMVS